MLERRILHKPLTSVRMWSMIIQGGHYDANGCIWDVARGKATQS